MKEGFLSVITKVETRLAYYESLDQANTEGYYGDFIKIVVKEVNVSLYLYLSETMY